MDASGCVPIVDVNSSTAVETWPLMLQAIETADIISLDLELSGLGKTTARGMEEQYAELCEVVSSRAIVSLGVACFKWEETHNNSDITTSRNDGGKRSEVTIAAEWTCPGVCVQVFNVSLLCQHAYTVDPSSARFLVAHGFDFNKQISLGLPYTPPVARTKTYSDPGCSLDVVLACVMRRSVPLVLHNGWLDLLFLYYACYGPLPRDTSTLLADLTEMFPGGVYDTKAIAQFKFYEDATFLEYLFRVSQRWSRVWSSEGTPHLKLRYPLWDQSVVGGGGGGLSCSKARLVIEEVDVSPPPSHSPQQLLLIQVCDSYATGGYCNTPHCHKSHDIMVAIEQKEQLAKVQRSKRKRKRTREHENDKRLESGDRELLESCDSHTTSDPAEQHSDDTVEREVEMETLFQKEIATAKAKLGQAAPTTNGRVFGSHRSGVDAFMTGFILTCYALQAQSKASGEGEGEREVVSLCGLAELRNCLANRPRSKHKMPLRIVKSQFAKNSITHKEAKERLDSLAKICR